MICDVARASGEASYVVLATNGDHKLNHFISPPFDSTVSRLNVVPVEVDETGCVVSGIEKKRYDYN